MDYTPREIVGWLAFDRERRKQEKADAIHTHALAAQGDSKHINKAIKDLTKE